MRSGGGGDGSGGDGGSGGGGGAGKAGLRRRRRKRRNGEQQRDWLRVGKFQGHSPGALSPQVEEGRRMSDGGRGGDGGGDERSGGGGGDGVVTGTPGDASPCHVVAWKRRRQRCS